MKYTGNQVDNRYLDKTNENYDLRRKLYDLEMASIEKDIIIRSLEDETKSTYNKLFE